jgi:putative heme-binding domain-containing protein
VAPPVYPLSETVDRFNDLFAANRFTSACSAIVVRSRALGEELNGAALICEPVHNLVHRAQLVEHGATFRATRARAEEQSEFIRSTDPWFRPVRVATGPDGMIWVVDMYRAVIEHPEWIPQAWQQQVDVRAGSDRGRIYRIVPTASAGPAQLPDITQQSSEELVAALASDSGTLRDMAQQELLQRREKRCVDALRSAAASSPSTQQRVHALWALNGLDELRNAELLDALRDEHPGVVRSAILLAEPRVAKNDVLVDALVALVDHRKAKVKLQLALTLGECTAPAAGIALGKLARDAVNDEWLAQAIVSSSKHHSLAVLKPLLSHLQNGEMNADATARLATMIASLVATADASDADPSALLARAISDAPANASWVFTLAAACADSANATKLDQASQQALRDVYNRATSLAVMESASPSLRCQAIQLFGRSLGSAGEERSVLAELLSPTTPLEVQRAAAQRLAEFQDRPSAEQLLASWSTLSHSVRDLVAWQLVSSAAGTHALIEHLESGAVLPGDLTPSVRQTLRQNWSQSLQARVNRILGKTIAANQELIQQYLQFQQAASATADLSRGQTLFQKHCASCHIPDAAGRVTGPNLANLTDRSPAALTESILAPNRSVEPQYRGYNVVLTDGRVLTGLIAEEAGDTVTLAQADGKRATVQRSEVEELRNSGVSLMPEGYQQEMDPAMLRDLVEYVRSGPFSNH